jgi:hypothetical protein
MGCEAFRPHTRKTASHDRSMIYARGFSGSYAGAGGRRCSATIVLGPEYRFSRTQVSSGVWSSGWNDIARVVACLFWSFVACFVLFLVTQGGEVWG